MKNTEVVFMVVVIVVPFQVCKPFLLDNVAKYGGPGAMFGHLEQSINMPVSGSTGSDGVYYWG